MYIYKPFTKKELKDHCDDWDSWNELVDSLNDGNYILKENTENGNIDCYEIDDNGKLYKNGTKTTKAVLLDDALRLGQALSSAKYWSTKEIRSLFFLD